MRYWKGWKVAVSDAITRCEEALAGTCGRRHCVLVGRGATALWMAYSMSDPAKRGVVLPALICLSPLFTVGYAGRLPLVADVAEDTATIDVASVERLRAGEPDIGAVVAVHLYGNAANVRALGDLCARNGVLLIEDAAQALGGCYADGAPFGSRGDISVLSFGHTKILDVGGGGAFLTDSDELASHAREMALELPGKPDGLAGLQEIYRRMYYAVDDLAKVNPRATQMLAQFPDLFREMYLYRADDAMAADIVGALGALDGELAHRKELADLCAQSLVDVPGITCLTTGGSGVTWRFSFRVASAMRQDLLERVRSEGYDISSWYPSIAGWVDGLGGRNDGGCPVAAGVSAEVVNIWVNGDYSLERAAGLLAVIRNFVCDHV